MNALIETQKSMDIMSAECKRGKEKKKT
jgi:hypothetical protein